MSDEKVSILVEAIDKASGVLGGVGGALKTLGGIAGGVALGGVAAFFGAVASGVGDARESVGLMAATSKTIDTMGNAAGVSAQHVADMASALSDANGASLFGDDQIQQSENLLLTFGEIKGATFDAATALTVDLAQALGGAPKDQAMMLGKALNDPIKGMTALGKAGLTFSDDQKAAIKAMQESGDMAGAQALIIAELNKQVGGQGAAAAAATGGWSQFTGRLGEAKEALGAAVLPLLNGLAGVLNSSVMPAVERGAVAFGDIISVLQDAGPLSSEFAETIGGIAAQLGLSAPMVDAFEQAIFAVQGAIQSVAAAFSDGGIQGVLQLFIDKLAEVSPGFEVLKGIVEAALPPIQDIVTSVFGIITGFIQEHGATMLADVTQVWQSIQALIDAVLPPIQAIVGAVFGAIATFLHTHGDDIKAFLASTWDAIASIIKIAVELVQAIIVPVFTFIAGFLASHSSEIQSILGSAWDAIKAVIDGALTLIKGILTAALQVIKGDWSGAWETIKSTLSQVWDDIKIVLNSAWKAIKTLFGGFVDDALTMGRNIINGIIDGVSHGVSALANAVSNAATNALNAAKNALGIHSPSSVFQFEVGRPIIDGVIDGIMGGAGDLANSLQGILDGALSAAQSAIEQFKSLADFGIDTGASTVAGAFQGGGGSKGGGFSLPHFASGVRGFGGGLAIVGERGPELVSLPSGANVYSNNEARAMGSTTINISFNAGAIVGAPGQNVEQLADKILDRIQNRVNARRTT